MNEAHHARFTLACEGRLGAKNDIFQRLSSQAKAPYSQWMSKSPKSPAAKKKAVSPYLQALYETGLTHYRQGAAAAAEQQFRAILQQAPDHANSWHALGVLARDYRQHQPAREYLEKAIQIDGTNPAYYADLGSVYRASGDQAAAMAQYKRALSIDRYHLAANNNLGLLYKDQGKMAEAVAHYQKALSRHPQSAELHNNLGLAVKDQGQFAEALQLFEQAAALKPDYVEAEWNRGSLALLLGDFARGWAGNEARLRLLPLIDLSTPVWTGQELAGKTIVLVHEQGLGDTVQFVRFAPLVKARGARVVLLCQPPLATLLQGTNGVDEIVTTVGQAPPHDYQVHLMSLPAIFATTLAAIPPAIAYSAPNSVDQWSSILPVDVRKIGLVWRGNPTHTNDHNRSMKMADVMAMMTALGNTGPIQWISLQNDPQEMELEALRAVAPSLIEAGSSLADFAATAALVRQLDMVITVDTSVAHVTGTVGLPVLLLLPFVPDWRWLLERTDSPWYPSMRLFRQSAPGDWRAVIEQVSQYLS